ncbi:MAG: hypothetical protein JWP92_2299 [Caulobacter sp.]|nr:hypothetical protein [Caulobacter sp.]
MSLLDRLRAQIGQTGPITVAEYMTRCLHDPRDGYYATRPALGPEGDFVTAPLVSQMFGELIGLWLVETWTQAGRPAPFRLVEIGPGDGTLMADLLRAARLAPDFLAAADLWLVEVSEPLVARQARTLAAAPPTPRWASRLEAVPGGAPLLLVANELLDCLPVHQFVRTADGWAERMVGLDAAGALAFGLKALAPSPRRGPVAVAQPPPVTDAPEDAAPGSVWEQSPAQTAFAAELGHRIARDGGVALLIDYGRDAPGFGDTLQAVRGHAKQDPLAAPGQADLTAWADFPAVLAAAREAGAQAGPLLTQGAFLQRLGIAQRAAALAAARPDRADTLARQLDRLVEPAQMGALFKVGCVHAPGPPPPAFEEA